LRPGTGADAGGAHSRLIEPGRPVALNDDRLLRARHDVPTDVGNGRHLLSGTRDDVDDLIPQRHLEFDDRLARIGVRLVAALVLSGVPGTEGAPALIDHREETAPGEL